MRPVEGKNPIEKDALHAKIFQTSQDEKNNVLKVIRNIFSKHPDYTIGIFFCATIIRSNLGKT